MDPKTSHWPSQLPAGRANLLLLQVVQISRRSRGGGQRVGAVSSAPAQFLGLSLCRSLPGLRSTLVRCSGPSGVDAAQLRTGRFPEGRSLRRVARLLTRTAPRAPPPNSPSSGVLLSVSRLSTALVCGVFTSSSICAPQYFNTTTVFWGPA